MQRLLGLGQTDDSELLDAVRTQGIRADIVPAVAACLARARTAEAQRTAGGHIPSTLELLREEYLGPCLDEASASGGSAGSGSGVAEQFYQGVDEAFAPAVVRELYTSEAQAVEAFAKAKTSAQQAYVACIKDEADDLFTDYSNCRPILGLAESPSAFSTVWDFLKQAAGASGPITAQAERVYIEQAIAKLQLAKVEVPDICKTNKYTLECAAAIKVVVDATGEGAVLDDKKNAIDKYKKEGGAAADNTALYIGLGIGAVAVLGILAVALSRRR
jgi:hypothetical protein